MEVHHLVWARKPSGSASVTCLRPVTFLVFSLGFYIKYHLASGEYEGLILLVLSLGRLSVPHAGESSIWTRPQRITSRKEIQH